MSLHTAYNETCVFCFYCIFHFCLTYESLIITLIEYFYAYRGRKGCWTVDTFCCMHLSLGWIVMLSSEIVVLTFFAQ